MQARHLKRSQLEAAAVHEAVGDHAAVDVGHHVLRAADDHDLAVAAAHVLRAAAARAPVLRAAAAAAQGLVNPRTVQKLARSAHGAAVKTNKLRKKRKESGNSRKNASSRRS